VPDAIASGADTLVSIGGVQSNHTRMVAATAAKIGMKCRLIQESWVPHEDAVYDRVGNILMSRVMGAEVQLVDEGFDIGIRESWEKALEDVKAKGGKPYAIPAGASVHKFGGLGYVAFAEEVRAQEAELGFKFDFIVVCTVTGSTHAGMVVGFAKMDASATSSASTPRPRRPRRAPRSSISRSNTSALIGGKDITDEDIVLNEDYAYPSTACPPRRRSRRSACRRGSKA
jgi:1-aminocyclopropane-1-carboxylate deaminase